MRAENCRRMSARVLRHTSATVVALAGTLLPFLLVGSCVSIPNGGGERTKTGSEPGTISTSWQYPSHRIGVTPAKCGPFGTPSTSRWIGAAIIVRSPRTKTCIVTLLRTSAQADALLFGRVTYEMMESAWRALRRTGARPRLDGALRPDDQRGEQVRRVEHPWVDWGRTRPPALHERRERPATDGHGSRRRPARASESGACSRDTSESRRVEASHSSTRSCALARAMMRRNRSIFSWSVIGAASGPRGAHDAARDVVTEQQAACRRDLVRERSREASAPRPSPHRASGRRRGRTSSSSPPRHVSEVLDQPRTGDPVRLRPLPRNRTSRPASSGCQ